MNTLIVSLGLMLATTGAWAQSADYLQSAQLNDSTARHAAYVGLGGTCVQLHESDDYTCSFFIDGSMYPYRKGGMLAVNAMFGDKRQHVLIDTGAALNAISSADAARLGLRLLDEQLTVRGAAAVIGRLAVADTLRIGRMAWANVPFVVADLSPFGNTADSPLRVGLAPIVGLPLLQSMGEVQIDFVGRTLTVPRQASRNALAQPNLTLNGRRNPMVEVRDGHGERLLMLFDTGSYDTSLSPRWYAAHKSMAIKGGTLDSLRLAGAGGTVDMLSWRMGRFSVAIGSGTAAIDSVQVATGLDLHSGEPISGGAYYSEGCDGVLGLSLIERFGRVTINLHDMFVRAEGSSEGYRREWAF